MRPVLLNSHLRIEAFLLLYLLALMTEALIERDFRDRMRKLDINRLLLYPEERPCTAPTTERLFELFADLRRHRLVDDTGRVHQRFYDKLNDPQLTVLRLFSISPSNISPPPRSRPPHERGSSKNARKSRRRSAECKMKAKERPNQQNLIGVR